MDKRRALRKLEGRHKKAVDLNNMLNFRLRLMNPITAEDQKDVEDDETQLAANLSEARAALTEVHEGYEANITAQRADEKSLFAAIRNPSTSNISLSTAAAVALRKTLRNCSDLNIQEKKLRKLRLHLDSVRKEASQALRAAGLEHYESQVRGLKTQVAKLAESVSSLSKGKDATLDAFYSAAFREFRGLVQGSGLSSVVTSQHLETSTINALASRLDGDVKTAYDNGLGWMYAIRERHDKFGQGYHDRLQRYLAETGNDNVDVADLDDAVIIEFNKSWVAEWEKVIGKLKTNEGHYIERRNLLMERDLESVVVKHNILGLDFPEFAGVKPQDGNVESMAAEALEAGNQNTARDRPGIERWVDNVQGADAPTVELQSTQSSINESIDDDVAPEDSFSSTDRRPWARKRIDDYRLECGNI